MPTSPSTTEEATMPDPVRTVNGSGSSRHSGRPQTTRPPVRPRGETLRAPLREQGDRRIEITPSAVGGAIITGVAAGSMLGPVGAIAGAVVGGVAGEILELRLERRQVSKEKTSAR